MLFGKTYGLSACTCTRLTLLKVNSLRLHQLPAPRAATLMDLTNTILRFVGGTTLAIVLYTLGQKLLNIFFRKQNLHAQDRISREILTLAIDQRSVFRLEVLQGELKGHKAEGVGQQITKEHLILDLGNTFAASEWGDEEILVFFQTTERRKSSFFHFQEKAAGTIRKEDRTLLCLPVPPQLEVGHKRSFLRISPSKESVR